MTWREIPTEAGEELVARLDLFPVVRTSLDSVHYFEGEPPTPYPMHGYVLAKDIFNGSYRAEARFLERHGVE